MLLQNILALCRERKIPVSRLEKEIGLGNATISRWGVSSPSVENVRKVAVYFGVTVDELLSRNSGNPASPAGHPIIAAQADRG